MKYKVKLKAIEAFIMEVEVDASNAVEAMEKVEKAKRPSTMKRTYSLFMPISVNKKLDTD